MKQTLLCTALLALLAACGQTTGTTPAPTAAASGPAPVVGLPSSPSTLSGTTSLRPLALLTGPVVGWGYNGYGQATMPADLTDVKAVAAGFYHSLALKNDGTVVAWGYNGHGQTTIPEGLTDVKAIAAGSVHSLALKSDGTMVAWGHNGYGQATIPVGLTDVKAIAAGGNVNLALKNDGTVVGWGDNRYEHLNIPSGLKDVKAIATSDYHSLALLNPPAPVTDTTPPVITATPDPATPDGQGGWYTSPVTVNWTAVDSESAISSQSGCDSTTLSTDTTGTTLTCTATSSGGTASNSITVKLDQTKPNLSPAVSNTLPPVGTLVNPVLLGSSVTVTPNATDATSGVASSSCTTPETSTVGSKTVTCTAKDNAGNTQSVSVPYSVIYNFRGFLQPVDNLPTVNTVKAGSSVPVKFGLSGNQGLNVLNGSPKVSTMTCGSSTSLDEIEQTVTAGSSSLSYDAASDTYSYVWKTDRSWAKTCRVLMVTLNDGTEHLAHFQFN